MSGRRWVLLFGQLSKIIYWFSSYILPSSLTSHLSILQWFVIIKQMTLLSDVLPFSWSTYFKINENYYKVTVCVNKQWKHVFSNSTHHAFFDQFGTSVSFSWPVWIVFNTISFYLDTGCSLDAIWNPTPLYHESNTSQLCSALFWFCLDMPCERGEGSPLNLKKMKLLFTALLTKRKQKYILKLRCPLGLSRIWFLKIEPANNCIRGSLSAFWKMNLS